MPQKFAKLPPFAIPCTLDESEDDKDNIEFGGKEYLSNGPGNLSVTCSGAATASVRVFNHLGVPLFLIKFPLSCQNLIETLGFSFK